ncbi:MAG: hypothetical protein F4X97_13890, partial [Boseongicola sp. SB0662_bin_57]|nr:hypothetical protein [Boseongicola sp. SB0662_bin_57]
MTVGEGSPGTSNSNKGYHKQDRVGSLTSQTMSHQGATAEVTDILLYDDDNRLYLRTGSSAGTTPPTGSFNLCFDGTAFTFNPWQGLSAGASGLVWKTHNSSGLTWSTGDMVAVALVTSTQSCPSSDRTPEFATGASIPDHSLAVNRASRIATLPAATGGDGTLVYSISPTTLPAGLQFDATARTITGTPTTVTAATAYTYTATDSDQSSPDSVSLTFDLEVVANATPDFGDRTVAAQSLTKDQAMTPVTLPTATGGNAPVVHAFTTSLPAGLQVEESGGAYTLRGTPTARQNATAYTWRATDSDGETASVDVSITIVQGSAPDFGNSTIANQTYTRGTAIQTLQLPTASGGDGTVNHELVGTLPAGLDLNSTTRRITGTPTETLAAQSYIWRATDSHGDRAELSFTIAVASPADPVATIDAGTSAVTEGTDAEFTVTLSAAAPSGGLTVNLTVAESTNGDHVDAANEGDRTLDFAQGETSKAYDVATVGDTTDEPNGSVTVTLKTGTGYTPGTDRSATVTVNDDDAAPTATLVLTPASISENGGVSTVTATLDRASSEATTLTVSAAAVSPATAADFTLSANRTLTVAAGATASAGAVTVTGVDNADTAADKEVTVSATATNTQGITAPSDVTLTIADDEGRHATDITNVQVSNTAAGAVVTWTLPVAAWGNVRVQLADGACATDIGTATDKAGTATTHTFAAASLTSHQAYCVKVTPVSGGEAPVTGNTATQTWTWTNPASDVSNLKVTDTLATGSVVTWTLPATAPANVRVQLSNNTCTTVWGTTDKPGTATTHTFTGLTVGQEYCARVAPVTGGTVGSQATVKWTATALPEATIAAGTSPVTEGTDAEFTVTLSRAAPAGGLTVNLTVAESTNGDHVDAANEGDGTLDFAEGETSKAYRVATVGDMNDEPDGSVTVTLKAGTGYTPGAAKSATVAVNDDDEIPALAGLTVSPVDGTTDRLRVSWTAHSGAERYVVQWKTGSGSASAFTGQNVTVRTDYTITDLLAGTTYAVRVSAIDTDPDPDVVAAVADGTGTTNAPTVRLSVSPGTVTEGLPVTVTATLSATLGSNVTIPVTLTPGTAEADDYGTLTDITVTAGQTTGARQVTTAQDDDTDDETFTVALGDTLPSEVTAGSPSSVTVTILDDDDGATTTTTTTTTGGGGGGGGGAPPDLQPEFPPGAAIPDQSYMEGVRIAPLVLPAATGGGLTYTLTCPGGASLPAGLAFDPATRTLSGTPTRPQARTVCTYAATAAGGSAATLAFAITVLEDPHRAQVRNAVEDALAAAARRAMASALDTVGARMGDIGPSAVSLAGHPVPLRDAAGTPPRDAAAGAAVEGETVSRSVTADELLGATAFSLHLAPPQDGSPGPETPLWSVWGRGDLGTFAGRGERNLRYDGDLRTGWLGIDARAGPWVAGLAVSRGEGEAGYAFSGDGLSGKGALETSVTALHPYGRWTLESGPELRAVAGIGRGEARHRPEGGETETAGLSMRMASLGFRQALPD